MPDIYLSCKIEGEEVNDLLTGVEVEENDTRADLATLVFGDSNRILSDVLNEGLEVEVDLGRTDAHALIFRGTITGVRAHFPPRGRASVEIQAVDNLIRLSYELKTRRWWNTTVSQVVREIAAEHRFQPGDIEPLEDVAMEEMRPRHQIAETDLGFLNRLADDYGCKLYTDHEDTSDSLNFMTTNSLVQADPLEQTLMFNANLVSFSGEFDAFAAAGRGRMVSTDPQTGERVEIEGDSYSAVAMAAAWVPDAGRIAASGDAAARLTRMLANATAKRAQSQDFRRAPQRSAGEAARPASDVNGTVSDPSRSMGLSGRGRATGNIRLRPRRMVAIEGYGGRWSGNWYLSRVRHTINIRQRSYYSDFVCTR